jgi:transcription initiation factor IIE alpha subunit
MLELEKLFGSVEKVKLIRLFISHPDVLFQVDDIAVKTKVKTEIVRKELTGLVAGNLVIKSKERFAKVFANTKTKKGAVKEYICFKLNKDFRFLSALETLVFNFENANRDALYERFLGVGRVKLFIVSGIFTGTEKARTDILYVGEAIKRNVAEKVVSDLQAEIGKEIRITVFDTEEFAYRYKMFDRFVRDILKDKHEKIVDKLKTYI